MNNSTRFNAAEAEDLIFELSESEDFDEALCSESKSDDDYFATSSIPAVAEVDAQFENEAQSCENDSDQSSCKKDVGDAVNDRKTALDANFLQSLSPSQPPSSFTNIITSLEAALNENNYDLLDLNPKEKKVYEAKRVLQVKEKLEAKTSNGPIHLSLHLAGKVRLML